VWKNVNAAFESFEFLLMSLGFRHRTRGAYAESTARPSIKAQSAALRFRGSCAIISMLPASVLVNNDSE